MFSQPPARPRRGRLRGRRDHRPRPDRGRRAPSTSSRRASGRQHLEVEVVGSDGAWLDGRSRPDRPRARAATGSSCWSTARVDLDALLARARRAGEVRTLRLPAAEALGAVHGGGHAGRAGQGGGVMSRWRSIWLVARREILERGRSRGFILSVLFTTAASSSARSSCPPLLFGGRGRRQGRGRPARRRRRSAPTIAVDRDRRGSRRSSCVPYPDARGGRGRPRGRRGRGRRRRAGRPARRRARSVLQGATDPVLQSIVSAAVVGPAGAGRAGRARTSTRPPWRPRSSRPSRRARPADRRRPGALPGRQHRRRADPRRHLQLRLHGPDRRRRGEAEPGRRGRPLDGPRRATC